MKPAEKEKEDQAVVYILLGAMYLPQSTLYLQILHGKMQFSCIKFFCTFNHFRNCMCHSNSFSIYRIKSLM